MCITKKYYYLFMLNYYIIRLDYKYCIIYINKGFASYYIVKYKLI